MPTIGNTSIAAISATSEINWICEALVGAAYRYTASTGDVVTEVAMYGDGTGTCELAIFVYSGGVPTTRVGSPVGISIGSTAGWHTAAASIALTAGVTYVVAADYYTSDGFNIRYESPGGTATSITGGVDGSVMPTTWEQTSTSGNVASFYATVTAAGGGPTGTATVSHAWALSASGTAPAVTNPVVVSVAESAVATAGTNHLVTLPASIASTDMVLVTMNLGLGTNPSINALTDWQQILDETVVNGIAVMRYTGTGVPSNPTFVSNVSTRSASIAWRISNADKTITPQIGTTATGSSATPDPPSVTPTGGTSKAYLFISFFGMAGEEADDDTWANTPPTNYSPTPPYQKTCGTAGTNLGGLIAAAYRLATTGAAENPGTFNVDVSAAWRAQTIIVHPTVVIPNGSATVTHAWALSAAGVRTPEGSGTVTHAWAISASGENFEPSLGSATVTHVWAQSASGQRTSRGSATTTHIWAGTATGSAAMGGSGTVSHEWGVSTAGERSPVGSATTAHSWALFASGGFNSFGVAATTHVWAVTAAGSAPTVGTSEGSATVGHVWATSANGERASEGTATTGHTWAVAASGKRVPKADATTTHSWALFASGGVNSFGTATAGHLWAVTGSGERTSEGSGTTAHVWALTASGVAPTVGVNDGSATVTHQWAVAANGVTARTGAASVSHLWTPTANGKRLPKATAQTTHSWLLFASGGLDSFGTATTGHQWALDASGIGGYRGQAAVTHLWALVAFGTATELVTMGMLDGQEFVDWQWGPYQIEEFLVG